jgi:hypothetical protein
VVLFRANLSEDVPVTVELRWRPDRRSGSIPSSIFAIGGILLAATVALVALTRGRLGTSHRRRALLASGTWRL